MTATFRAMSVDVTMRALDGNALSRLRRVWVVKRIFAQAERTFSRFRAQSELSRLNRSRRPTIVSREMFGALERARAYWALTDGWFDPTVGRALIAAGYDRSFVSGALGSDAHGDRPSEGRSFGDVLLDPRSRTVCLPEDVALDCGGFIKGWAVDRAAARLPFPSVITAGGDAYLKGNGPDGSGWRMAVENPTRPGWPLLSFRLADRAIATSAPNRRRWRVRGAGAHHLIDPFTSRPSASDLAQVSVVAGSAELADVLAKTAYLRGSADGRRFLHRFSDVSAVLVLRTGMVEVIGSLLNVRFFQ